MLVYMGSIEQKSGRDSVYVSRNTKFEFFILALHLNSPSVSVKSLWSFMF